MHKSNYFFGKDKKLGDEAEELILAKLQKTYPLAHRVDGYHPEYDIMIPEINKTIEVKRDMRAGETGNIVVECAKKSKTNDISPSGIMSSTADFWVIMAAGDILMFAREDLKQYILNSKFRKVWGGDRWSSEMYIVPLSDVYKQNFLCRID